MADHAGAEPSNYLLAAGGAFNRTEILIETKHGASKARSLPWGRQRRIKLGDIVKWVYGRTPVSKRTERSQTTPSCSIVIVRKNGKITRVADRISELADARELAAKCAIATGLGNDERDSLRNPSSKSRDIWWFVTALALFALIAGLVIWSAQQV